ncbi:hypothetical protein [Mycoplasma phocoeninasale]|uniref:hypothetical protein n=1 Tax=Mycoplasma phocoeninasale TaxID=2726117 RepID=UPI00196843ED|nr:hypothetical protein [Mycoplasma phocoeninasale]MBN0970530.1 hypothetical protein [Mycoplasma phocoeninasale]
MKLATKRAVFALNIVVIALFNISFFFINTNVPFMIVALFNIAISIPVAILNILGAIESYKKNRIITCILFSMSAAFLWISLILGLVGLIASILFFRDRREENKQTTFSPYLNDGHDIQ